MILHAGALCYFNIVLNFIISFVIFLENDQNLKRYFFMYLDI